MKAERRAVAAIAFATVAVFADMYLAQPLLPALSREYRVSATAASTTVSALVLAIALTSSAYGPLAELAGPRTVMVAGCALLGLATLAAALAPNLPALVALRGLQGVLVPSVSAVAVAYLGRLRAGRDPGTLVGLYIGATVAGGMLGRVGSGLIAGAASWRASFVAFGGLTLAAAAALAAGLRPVPPRARGSTSRAFAAAYAEMGAHLFDSRLLGAFVVGGTLFFGFIGIFTYLPYLLTAPPFSLSTAGVAWIYSSYLAGVFTAPLAGSASPRFSRRALMATGFAVALGGTALTLVPALGAVIAGTIVLCIGMFMAQAVAPAFVNVTARVAKTGANALYQVFYYVGAVLGSTLPGLALERWGWSGVVVTCSASFALGLAASVLLCHDDVREPADVAVTP
jgi:YNFM family putative membrane transporter